MIVGMSETMEKFTLKISKELRCYELDEDKKQLHITGQKKWRTTPQMVCVSNAIRRMSNAGQRV